MPVKKANCTSNKSQSKPNSEHKAYLVDFFDKNLSAVIQGAAENWTKSFEGLEIKKSRVTEFMKEECNLSIKVVTRHPVVRNSNATLEARAQYVEEWLQKGMLYIQNCVLLDESGFDINMHRSRAWSQRGIQAIVESSSARAVSYTIIGVISAFGVVNVTTFDFIKSTIDFI